MDGAAKVGNNNKGGSKANVFTKWRGVVAQSQQPNPLPQTTTTTRLTEQFRDEINVSSVHAARSFFNNVNNNTPNITSSSSSSSSEDKKTLRGSAVADAKISTPPIPPRHHDTNNNTALERSIAPNAVTHPPARSPIRAFQKSVSSPRPIRSPAVGSTTNNSVTTKDSSSPFASPPSPSPSSPTPTPPPADTPDINSSNPHLKVLQPNYNEQSSEHYILFQIIIITQSETNIQESENFIKSCYSVFSAPDPKVLLNGSDKTQEKSLYLETQVSFRGIPCLVHFHLLEHVNLFNYKLNTNENNWIFMFFEDEIQQQSSNGGAGELSYQMIQEPPEPFQVSDIHFYIISKRQLQNTPRYLKGLPIDLNHRFIPPLKHKNKMDVKNYVENLLFSLFSHFDPKTPHFTNCNITTGYFSHLLSTQSTLLQSLKTLDLSFNCLRSFCFENEHIKAVVLQNPLKNCDSLNLSNNFISYFHWSFVFLLFPNLKSLDLSNNYISSITNNDFYYSANRGFNMKSKLNQLKQLNISGNPCVDPMINHNNKSSSSSQEVLNYLVSQSEWIVSKQWTVAQVKQWLKWNKLNDDLIYLFESNDIDGEVLMNLSSDDITHFLLPPNTSKEESYKICKLLL